MELAIAKYKKTELGFIPYDWEIKSFEEVMEGFSSGQTPYRGNPNFYKGNIPWITSGELNYNIITDTKEKITIEGVKDASLKIIPKGTFLMAITGLEAEGTRGSCAITGIDATTNQSCMALYPKKGVLLTEYLYHFYIMYGNELAFKYCQGTKQQSFTGGIAKKLPIIIPPTIDEQLSIVTALSNIDSFIIKLEKLIIKKSNIAKGALQELLTPQQKWEIKSLGEIAEIRDGTHQTPKYVRDGIPFYSVENVTNNDFVNTKYISEEEHKFLTKNFRIEKGDILMTRIGSIGECKLVDWDVNASFYVSLALLKIRKGYSPNYLYHYSKTSHFKKEADLNSLQSAIPRKINLGPISNIKIALPKSYEEQNHIANTLSDIDNEINVLKSQLTKYRNIKVAMMQSLLTGKIRLIK